MSPEAPVPVTAPGTSVAPLDRAALERVLARAAELQALSTEPPEGLSDAQLLELGNEVGISGEHLRQALAEERTRIATPLETGVVGSWFGSSTAAVSRVVRGTPADILALLDNWMQREELLRVRRRLSDRLTWEARRDFLGSMQASFNLGGRAYSLTAASEVGATVVAVDEERVLVRLDANFGPGRRRNVGWAGVLAGFGVTSSAGLVALASMSAEPGAMVIGGLVGSVWTLVAGVGSAAIARAQRRKVGRGQLALEQVLDRLEHGEMRAPKSPILDFLSSVR
ncbi:MAG TPA: hypothetical protein VF981_11360 [Gemmatimonadaceae bacterium]